MELEPRQSFKQKVVFRSNPYKHEVMITFLIEMPGLPNFGQMTSSTYSLIIKNFVAKL